MQEDGEEIHTMLRRLDLPEGARKNRRFVVFSSSPLARKIIVFNLIALGILLTSILYLNQSEDGLVNYRRVLLARQTNTVAEVFSQNQIFTGDLAERERRFLDVASPTGAIVQLFDHSGNKVHETLLQAKTGQAGQGLSSRESSGFADFMQSFWTRMAQDELPNAQGDIQHLYDLIVADILLGTDTNVERIVVHNGETFVVAARIVSDGNGPVGVVLLSSLSGEIDTIIRQAREQILQMFFLATLSSIVLSIVLANSIARPLRRLAVAAETTHHGESNRLNPGRVDIPDLTARPDEIGDLSRAMRNMANALVAQIDETKAFSADVSHEIKNPLTSLRSAVETLDYVTDDESRDALLAVIHSDVSRIDRLITDISSASRLEAELVREEWVPIDLDAALKGMVDYHQEQAAQKQGTVLFETDRGNHVVSGLEGRLTQVFTNLITNALGFIPPNGWVKVSVSGALDGIVTVTVTDNGPGIPPDNLKDVFKRFYSERPAEQFGEHSGLGLAISKQIVEAHGGSIVATNTAKGGAQFTVIFPQ